MAMLSRDDFVNQLIEELKNQNSSSNNSSGSSSGGFYNRYRGSHDIFRTLCYDYPIVNSHGMFAHHHHYLTTTATTTTISNHTNHTKSTHANRATCIEGGFGITNQW